MHLALPVQEDAISVVSVSIADRQSDFVSFYSPDLSLRERRQKDKEERLSLVLWRRPVTTLHYFLLETLLKLKEWTFK